MQNTRQQPKEDSSHIQFVKIQLMAYANVYSFEDLPTLWSVYLKSEHFKYAPQIIISAVIDTATRSGMETGRFF